MYQITSCCARNNLPTSNNCTQAISMLRYKKRKKKAREDEKERKKCYLFVPSSNLFNSVCKSTYAIVERWEREGEKKKTSFNEKYFHFPFVTYVKSSPQTRKHYGKQKLKWIISLSPFTATELLFVVAVVVFFVGIG